VKIFSKTFSIVIYVLDAILICIAIAHFTLMFKGINAYVVQSGSMEPVIHTGARAFIDNRDLDVGIDDIVEYETIKADGSPSFVLHRIVGENEDGTWITKGDANDVIDLHSVPKSAIRGKYKFQIPLAGYLSPVWIGFIIFVLVGLNILAYLLEVMAKMGDEETAAIRL